MLRITEVKLPLDHSPEALLAAVAAPLGLGPDAIEAHVVVRRGYDARRRSAIELVYTVDVAVADEAAVLARAKDDRHVGTAPETGYRFVTHAPAALDERPIVIGAGPAASWRR